MSENERLGYVCFWKGLRWETYARSSYEAQCLAAKHFKVNRQHEITVVLAEVDGKSVVHKADF